MYMSDLSVLKKMYFIVDAKGNFYHLSSNGQLVQARDKAEADMFSFTEANQRIGGGRKAKFYTTIPVDEEIPNNGLDDAINTASLINKLENNPDYELSVLMEEEKNGSLTFSRGSLFSQSVLQQFALA